MIFDSGVGGLSILEEVAGLLPGLDLTYVADNAAFPYGTKPEAVLTLRVVSVLRRMAAAVGPDLVVIACNTASTSALAAVREALPLPVVGVVPAVKPAAQLSRSKVIGLLGTAATIASPYTGRLIAEFAAECTIRAAGATALVELAERKIQGEAIDPAAVRIAIAPLFAGPEGERIDTVVLGCTHFPLLRPELEAASGRALHWVDSGPAVARRVAVLLGPAPGPAGRRAAFFTAPAAPALGLSPGWRSYGFEEVTILPV